MPCNDTRNDRIEMSLILNDNLQANFEFDTGAGVCIMPKAWLTLFTPEHRPVLQTCNVKLNLANGQLANITGSVHIDVITSACKRMKPVNTTFYVVDGPHALLGRPLIRALFPGLYNNMMNLSGALDYYHSDKNYIQVPSVTMVAQNVPASVNPIANSNSIGEDNSHIGNDTKVVPLCENLPEAPTGDVSLEEGAKHCKLIAKAHPALFDGKQGTAKGIKARLRLKPGAEKYFKVMPPAKVPFGIRDLVNKKIAKMDETSTPVSGIGLKISSQVVPVVKKRGEEIDVRPAINYKTTLNNLIEDEHFPFPSMNDQCDNLSGGECYSTLDVTGAFTHIVMEDESKYLLTYSMKYEFRQPDRLPSGVKTAPAIFQSFMLKVLAGIPKCAVIVDDICVTGSNPAEHFKNLESVLHRLEEAGMKLNTDKCKFYLSKVKYCGRIISQEGQRMDPCAVEAILNMPPPSSRHELQSFLGYLSYVRRHVPDLSRFTPVLSALLKKNINFVWTSDHEKVFQQCKKLA